MFYIMTLTSNSIILFRWCCICLKNVFRMFNKCHLVNLFCVVSFVTLVCPLRDSDMCHEKGVMLMRILLSKWMFNNKFSFPKVPIKNYQSSRDLMWYTNRQKSYLLKLFSFLSFIPTFCLLCLLAIFRCLLH